MTNPFDKTFFKLLLGFSFILLASFALMFFVGKYSYDMATEEEALSIYAAIN